MSIITASPAKSSLPTTTAPWTATPEWFLAGKAEFTVSNATGQHYSYQILKKEDRKGDPFWVLTLLSGPDNNLDFMRIGVVGTDGSLKTTRNSKVSADARSFRVAAWALKRVWAGKPLPAGYSINHKGRCGRCGRALTRPEGIDPKGWRYGFGETCFKYIESMREAIAAKPAPQVEATAALPTAKDHPANRFESWGERFARINREEIEAQEAGIGVNPLY